MSTKSQLHQAASELVADEFNKLTAYTSGKGFWLATPHKLYYFVTGIIVNRPTQVNTSATGQRDDLWSKTQRETEKMFTVCMNQEPSHNIVDASDRSGLVCEVFNEDDFPTPIQPTFWSKTLAMKAALRK